MISGLYGHPVITHFAGLSTDTKPTAPNNSIFIELDTGKQYFCTGGLWLEPISIDYDAIMKGIAHRGYSITAPENTLPAYTLAREKGFMYAETDISFTKDGVPVLLHDATINRTSNGSGSINDLTWVEVQEYDFGSWKNTKYAGTRIPNFEQFIGLCSGIGLHPYIELKANGSYKESQIQGLVDVVKRYGIGVTWISFSAQYLNWVKNYDESARLGYLVNSVSSTQIDTVLGMKTGENDVFLDSSAYGDTAIGLCSNAGIPLEIWTIDSEATILGLNSYISGVTSNKYIAGKVIYENM